MVCCADVRKTPLGNFTLMLKYALHGNDSPMTIFKASLEIQEAVAAVMRKSIKGTGSKTLACYDFERSAMIDSAIVKEDTQHVAYSGASEISAIEVLWCIHRLLYGLSGEDKLIVKIEDETIGTWHCAKSLREIDNPAIISSIEKYLNQM